ncbi:hypothetical protein JYU20_00545 [Bacteroidales bacterium AH-315-I05]|nr:hypothetical protein [Bacteroidales bacterium AH-315-I05]
MPKTLIYLIAGLLLAIALVVISRRRQQAALAIEQQKQEKKKKELFIQILKGQKALEELDESQQAQFVDFTSAIMAGGDSAVAYWTGINLQTGQWAETLFAEENN